MTCAKGTKVATDFHACRTKTGPAGRCVRKVSGYACREQRTTVGTEIEREGQLRQGQEEEAQAGQLQLSADRLSATASGSGLAGSDSPVQLLQALLGVADAVTLSLRLVAASAGGRLVRDAFEDGARPL